MSGGAPALRRASSLLLALAALEVFAVVACGASPLLGFAFGPVGSAGLAARLAVLGGLCALRLRTLAAPRRRLSRARLLLVLLLLPALLELHVAGGRLDGDGTMYYVYTRSLVKDHDLDFTNEYAHYGLITRGDPAVPATTGLRRAVFAVGPGLMSVPFFLGGEAVAGALALAGLEVDRSGYGPCHVNAVALGGLLYGFAALLLIHAVLLRHFRPATALGAVLLVWGATFLHWYMVQQPILPHAPSACLASLVLWLWERGRRGPGGFLLLGLATGFAMSVRWQNGVLLVLPGLELAERFARALRGRGAAPGAGAARAAPATTGRPAARLFLRLATMSAALAAGAALGALPQMAAWKALYGQWRLASPPRGEDFLRLDHPFVLETLFSSRHGLLSWTPVFWAGYLGFLPLLRRRRGLALTLLVPLALMSYVNLCSGDWWAGGSFSNRRFDGLLPIFAFGFAAALEWACARLRRRPQLALVALGAPFVVWNLALAAELQRDLVSRDDTLAFPVLVGHGWRALFGRVGSPNTWPASWIFAWRYGRPAGQYDLLVGRYLFYRQNNLGGVIEIGAPGDDPMLGEGFGRLEREDGVGFRRVRGRARLFAPLDVPETLELRLRVQAVGAPREVQVGVNGRPAGRLVAGTEWDEARLVVATGFWRRELNEIALEAGAGEVRLGRVSFVRLKAPR